MIFTRFSVFHLSFLGSMFLVFVLYAFSVPCSSFFILTRVFGSLAEPSAAVNVIGERLSDLHNHIVQFDAVFGWKRLLLNRTSLAL